MHERHWSVRARGGKRLNAIRLAYPRHVALARRGRGAHRQSDRPGLRGRAAGFFRRLADRALFHRRERLQRLADVCRRARHEDRTDPHRLRRGADAVPPSGAARRPARPARQSQQGPHRCRHRQGHGLQRIRIRGPRPAQPRQPRAHGGGRRHPRARLARGAAHLQRQVPQGPHSRDPAQARATARPAAVAQRHLARLVQGMRTARRAHPDRAPARGPHQGALGDLCRGHRRGRPRRTDQGAAAGAERAVAQRLRRRIRRPRPRTSSPPFWSTRAPT